MQHDSQDAGSVHGGAGMSTRSKGTAIMDIDNASLSDSEGDAPKGQWRFMRGADGGHCGGSCGCGSNMPTLARPTAQIRFDIKPKDPPTFHGKAIENVEVWSQQVDNYLQLLGGDNAM